MPEIIFVTENSEKYNTARHAFEAYRIKLTQNKLDIDEIQSEDGDKIIRDKATKAYKTINKPLVVTDDTWNFAGLGGFPGPYMHSVNHWFGTDEFLRLTAPLADRRIILTHRIAYQDEDRQKIFQKEYVGTILHEARGSYGTGFQKIISMPGDNGLSVAEVYDKGVNSTAREVSDNWKAFLTWYKTEMHGSTPSKPVSAYQP